MHMRVVRSINATSHCVVVLPPFDVHPGYVCLGQALFQSFLIVLITSHEGAVTAICGRTVQVLPISLQHYYLEATATNGSRWRPHLQHVPRASTENACNGNLARNSAENRNHM